jgi:hypothetical protein
MVHGIISSHLPAAPQHPEEGDLNFIKHASWAFQQQVSPLSTAAAINYYK